MTNRLRRAAARFAGDREGSVAAIFAVSMVAIMLCAGFAIDYTRATSARGDLQDALDAASLAAAKALSSGETDTATLRTLARAVFDANYLPRFSAAVVDAGFKVEPDTNTKTVKVSATANVKTTFMGIANIDDLDVASASTSTVDGTKFEIAMMVDMTGSMASTPKGSKITKIASLKAAATSFVDTMLPASGANDATVRIALAPFAEGVNAGSYAAAVSGGKSKACVVERSGSYADSDAAPSVAPLGVPASPSCPGNTIRPLTNSRSNLVADIGGFTSSGYTAGHIGTQWARYLVSTSWNYLWPSTAQATAPGTKGVKKIVILMTDGIYNTSYNAKGVATVVEPNSASTASALAACAAMDKEGTVVYTIGFDLTGSTATAAKKLLQDCASTIVDSNGLTRKAFYDAVDDAALKAAYAEIAAQLLKIRLSS